jgi:hypothetical protein
LDVSGNANVSGDFFLSQTTLPPLLPTQLGYQNTVTSNTAIQNNFPPPYLPLVSASIPPGVWLVEGSFQGYFNNVTLYVLSLSSTGTFDTSRANVILSDNFSIGEAYTISSTAFVLPVTTTIVLYGYLTGGSAINCINTIRYTKIG